MCHLSKQDTAQAIGEMYRVLKEQGLCLLGVISADCWPKSRLGQEKGHYIHVLLLDRHGRILWRAEGAYTPEKGESLAAAVLGCQVSPFSSNST